MALKDKSSFGGGRVAAPNLQGTLTALGNINTMITDYEKADVLARQQAIANQRADALLGIQQAQEGRAISEFDRLATQRESIAKAADIQKNITSGVAGQQRFEEAANIIGAAPVFDAAIAQLDPTAPDYNVKVEALRAQVAPNIIRDAELEKIGTGYEAVSRAGGYDGLKYNVADEGYKQRIYDQLIAEGVDPKMAREEATYRDALVRTTAPTKAQIAQRKASAKVIQDGVKNRLDLVKNKYSQGKVASGGNRGKGSYGITKLKDAVESKGFSSSMLSFGTDKQKVIDAGNTILSKYKPTGMKSEDVADALFQLSEGRANATWSWDPSVDLGALERRAAEIATARQQDAKAYSGSTYKKFGPGYATEAAAIIKSGEAAMAALGIGSEQGAIRATGLAELEKAMTGTKKDNLKSTTPKDNLSTKSTSKTPSTKFVVPSTTPGLDAAGKTFAAERAAIGSPKKVVEDNLDSLNEQIKNTPKPITTSEYDALENLKDKRKGMELSKRLKATINMGGLQAMTDANKNRWKDLGSAINEGILNISDLPINVVKFYMKINKDVRDKFESERAKLVKQDRLKTAHDVAYNINPITPNRK